MIVKRNVEFDMANRSDNYAQATLAIQPPEWTLDALCAQVSPEIFFPESGGSTREAKLICRGCLARQPCLEEALATDERWGVRGALSPQERRKLKRRRAAS